MLITPSPCAKRQKTFLTSFKKCPNIALSEGWSGDPLEPKKHFPPALCTRKLIHISVSLLGKNCPQRGVVQIPLPLGGGCSRAPALYKTKSHLIP